MYLLSLWERANDTKKNRVPLVVPSELNHINYSQLAGRVTAGVSRVVRNCMTASRQCWHLESLDYRSSCGCVFPFSFPDVPPSNGSIVSNHRWKSQSCCTCCQQFIVSNRTFHEFHLSCVALCNFTTFSVIFFLARATNDAYFLFYKAYICPCKIVKKCVDANCHSDAVKLCNCSLFYSSSICRCWRSFHTWCK